MVFGEGGVRGFIVCIGFRGFKNFSEVLGKNLNFCLRKRRESFERVVRGVGKGVNEFV